MDAELFIAMRDAFYRIAEKHDVEYNADTVGEFFEDLYTAEFGEDDE